MIKVGVFSEDEDYAKAVSLAISGRRTDANVSILTEREQAESGDWDVKLLLEEYFSLKEVLALYDAQLSEADRRTLPCSPSCRLTAVSSAYGGLGQTTVCRALGGLLSAAFQKRILYLDLSGHTEGCLPADGMGADQSEILYRICCEDRAPELYESAFLRDEYGLYELPQRCGFTPAAELTEEEADGFVRKLACSCMFDSIILDIDYKLPELRFFAGICEENVLLKPAFGMTPLYGFFEAWLRKGSGGEDIRRLHILDLSGLGRAVRPGDADIYSELGALLLPLARDLAGRMLDS